MLPLRDSFFKFKMAEIFNESSNSLKLELATFRIATGNTIGLVFVLTILLKVVEN